MPSIVPRRLITAISNICHAVTYPQFTPLRATFWLQVPPCGTVLLLLVYLAFVLALEFIKNDVAGAQYWTSLGIRAGWLAIAQMPLLILLAGKNNLIGLVTGSSYGRLNILHRWVSRTILLMVALHVGYQNYGWTKYGVRSLEWSTDTCVPTGFAAFALLLWLNLSTLAPIRNFSYEVFVLQHLVTFFGFIIAIMYHLPSTALETRIYIWIPIGLFLFDRLLRTARLAWNNPRAGRATVVSMGGEVTKIRVRDSRVRKWGPGSYVLLSIPRYGVFQSHPATIASTPASHDGDLLFLLKAHKGFTKNLLSTPNISTMSLPSGATDEKAQVLQECHRAFVDGPYGATQGDFAAFDTVLLIAGSTGITFVLSIVLDLAARVCSQKLALRRLELVWAVKRQLHTSWVSDELKNAFTSLQAAGVETRLRLFVTCDGRVTERASGSKGSGCYCDASTRQMCCCEDLNAILRPDTALQTDGETRLHFASVDYCRPDMDLVLRALLPQAQGELGVAVCGPLGLSTAVRNTVARSVKGTNSIYLHVEGFGW